MVFVRDGTFWQVQFVVLWFLIGRVNNIMPLLIVNHRPSYYKVAATKLLHVFGVQTLTFLCAISNVGVFKGWYMFGFFIVATFVVLLMLPGPMCERAYVGWLCAYVYACAAAGAAAGLVVGVAASVSVDVYVGGWAGILQSCYSQP